MAKDEIGEKTRDKIMVYDGWKVSAGELITSLRESFNDIAIERVSGRDLQAGTALDDSVLAFVLPGIIDDNSPYNDEIGVAGNHHIRDYVERGGIFLGTCAGAYYACRDIVYDPPWLEQHKTSSPGLDFFNGLAKGPAVSGPHDEEYSWYSDCTVTTILCEQPDGSFFRAGVGFGNGPAYIPYDTDLDQHIIARYEEAAGKPAAIVSKRIGKGLALFCGVLPFFRYNVDHEKSRSARLRTLNAELKNHEEERQAVWNVITGTIKSHRAAP